MAVAAIKHQRHFLFLIPFVAALEIGATWWWRSAASEVIPFERRGLTIIGAGVLRRVAREDPQGRSGAGGGRFGGRGIRLTTAFVRERTTSRQEQCPTRGWDGWAVRVGASAAPYGG